MGRDFVGRSWSLTVEFTIGGRLDGDLIVERARPWLVAVKEGQMRVEGKAEACDKNNSRSVILSEQDKEWIC